MNLFTKAGPWVVASLFAAASVIGQNTKCAPAQKSFEQGHEMMQSQMMAGYNAPARIDVRGAWDFYATGSFTYWEPVQENMELCIVDDTTAGLANGIYGDVVNMHFKFKPGFKVGLGMNFDHDNWDSFVQYTWFRGTQHARTTESSPFNILETWGSPNVDLDGTISSASEKWKLHMDLLDWELARSHYVGTNLSFRPFFAARAAWIRQNVNVKYATATVEKTVQESSHSWAIGPRAGLYSNWMLGQGFRLYGNGAGDILYTQYTKLKYRDSQRTLATDVVALQDRITQKNAFGLRTHLDMELGFGWGSYFDNNNWHVDLTAGYAFQVFFDQNMFRKYVDDTMPASSILPMGNLYVHGLTMNARFDF